MIAVTVVIVISFSYYGQKSTPIRVHACVVKVGDRCYRQKEAQKLATHFDVALNLGMYDFAIPMMNGQIGERDPLNFVLNLIVLRNEAAKLGIEPSPEQIVSARAKLPIFQQPWVDAAYIRDRVPGPNGFTKLTGTGNLLPASQTVEISLFSTPSLAASLRKAFSAARLLPPHSPW